MVVSCAAFGCTNRHKKGSGISFYKFPLENKELLQEWLKAIRRDNFKPSTHHRICSNHFDPSCFLPNYVNIRKLRDSAIPSVFAFPDHLKKRKKGRPSPKKRKIEKADEDEEVYTPEETVLEHTYAVSSSPSKVAAKLNSIISRKEENVQNLRRSCQYLKRKCERQDKEISSLQALLSELEKKNLINQKTATLLDSCFSDIQTELFCHQASKSVAYSNTLKSFALSLYFYSPRAYEFVRESFNLSLPHVNTLRKWYNTVDGKPGFTQEALDSIKEQFKNAAHTVHAGIVFDEMSIRKKIEWDAEKFTGYVDFGGVCSEEQNELTEAKEALVVMGVGVNHSWKIPIAYFLTAGVSATQKAGIMTTSIILLHEINVNVVSITFDGLSSNLAMAEELGASMKIDNLRPWFPNPVTGHNVYIILDACHMLKLMRGTLEAYKVILNCKGGTIDWSYIADLHKLQTEEGLRAANKLTSHHVHFKGQKMKVNLAAQTLSSSVGTALDFLRGDLKLDNFQGSESTAEFCFFIDKLFDITNSKNPLAKGYKAPLSKSNKKMWGPFLKKMQEYLLGLTLLDGKPLYKTQRKTGVLGFLIFCSSLQGLFDDLVETGELKYLLTYKFSQDHVEMFFSMIRGRLGWNNNPSPLQFKAAYKHLLVKNDIRSNKNANCTPQDGTQLLSWAGKKALSRLPPETLDPLECSARRCSVTANSDDYPDHDYIVMPSNMSEYSSNVVMYIAGFVAERVTKKIHCQICIAGATSNSQASLKYSDFLNRKNNGGLTFPSESVVRICRETERRLRVLSSQGKPPKGDKVLKLQCDILRNLQNQNLFPELTEHLVENVYPENHSVMLLKCIVKMYMKVRCHHLANMHNCSLHKSIIRQQLTKSILFQNQ